MAQAKSIAPHSRALKNLSTISRGERAEKTAQDYFKANGFRVLFHKLRLRYAEVDFLLECPVEKHLILCEVKQWKFTDGGLSQPVSDAQKERLRRCVDHLRITGRGEFRDVRTILATVNENEVRVFWDFL